MGEWTASTINDNDGRVVTHVHSLCLSVSLPLPARYAAMKLCYAGCRSRPGSKGACFCFRGAFHHHQRMLRPWA